MLGDCVMMGYSEPFVNTDADNAELANYADFHAMKLALRNGNMNDNADNNDNNGEAVPRNAKAAQQNGETHLNVYPNPTDDILYVELSGVDIKSVGLYDLQGRVVETR